MTSFFRSVSFLLVVFQFLKTSESFKIVNNGLNIPDLISDFRRTGDKVSFKNEVDLEFSNTKDVTDLIVKSLVPFYIGESFLHENNTESSLFEKIRNTDKGTLQSPINGQCVQHLKMLFDEVLQILVNPPSIVNASTWALQMIDAWGKVPEGILSGHVNSYGDWDECVNIDVNIPADKSNFQGKYCWTYLIPTALVGPTDKPSTKESVSIPEFIDAIFHPVSAAVFPSIAVCLPSTCSQEEVQTALILLFSSIAPSLFPAVAVCNTNDYPPLNAGAYAMISVLSVLSFIIICSSILDVVLSYRETFHEIRQGTLVQILLAFSLVTNIRKWQNTDSSEGGFGCIHGLRFLSTCWVLLCHTVLIYSVQLPSWNTIDQNNIYKSHWTMYFTMNGYFSVDTFFTMSGLLACYSILKGLEKMGGNASLFSLIIFHLKMYLHRYLRLTPTYGLIIGILATLYPYFGDGPGFTSYAEFNAEQCKKHWWHNLLYVNNIVYYNITTEDEMCEIESWYIANDMQFFILAPIFVTLIWKWKVIGMAVLGSACVASILTPAIVVGTEKLPPTNILWKSNDTVAEVYFRPWHRIGPYLVGMWMGYVLFKIGRKPVKLPKLVVVGGWMLSTATALSLILGVIPYYYPDNDDSAVGAGFYAGLSKFTWGIVICWIIFACSKGYGGWINSFLSWKVFIPLGRLTFCVYLSSFSVQALLHTTIRQPMQFEMYRVTNIFFSHLIMCFLVGFLLTMTLESPFIALEKIMFGTGTVRDLKKKEDLNGNNLVKGVVYNSAPHDEKKKIAD